MPGALNASQDHIIRGCLRPSKVPGGYGRANSVFNNIRFLRPSAVNPPFWLYLRQIYDQTKVSAAHLTRAIRRPTPHRADVSRKNYANIILWRKITLWLYVAFLHRSGRARVFVTWPRKCCPARTLPQPAPPAILYCSRFLLQSYCPVLTAPSFH